MVFGVCSTDPTEQYKALYENGLCSEIEVVFSVVVGLQNSTDVGFYPRCFGIHAAPSVIGTYT